MERNGTERNEMETQRRNETPIPWQWINCIESIVMKDPKLDIVKQTATEILPWLYLSNEDTACNIPTLNSLGITHVLSLNGAPAYKLDWLKKEYQHAGIVNHRIHAEDEEGYDLIGRHWEDCLNFFMSVVQPHQDPNTNNKVLVHCVAGINRSGLVACAAYMTFEHDVNVLDAVRYCAEKRGHCFLWNKSFQKQLCCLAAQKDLLGDAPAGFSDEQVGTVATFSPPIRAFDRLI
mmetsp:Transcript_6676/g.9578  ORF Transcript_6676/g.9578 Transcript_6676/m.9578 type:complete len:234 (+) Transcript_6676:28-729(+)